MGLAGGGGEGEEVCGLVAVGASVANYQLACAAGTEREGRFPSWQSPCMVSIVLLCGHFIFFYFCSL